MKNKKPLFSVITVCFNSENTIEKTIMSLNKQTYSNIQHVFIDGGSNDSTLSIINKKSNRENIIISEKDYGIYDAMNKGLAHATGEYISFLNSDDIFFDKYTVEKIVKNLLYNSSDVSYGNITFFKNDPNKIVRKWISGKFSINKLALGWHPPHPSLVVSKRTIEKIGLFDIKFKITSDYDYILRLFKLKNLNVSYLNENIVNMRLGGASTSFNGVLISLKEFIMILNKHNFSYFRITIILFVRYFNKLSQIKI